MRIWGRYQVSRLELTTQQVSKHNPGGSIPLLWVSCMQITTDYLSLVEPG